MFIRFRFILCSLIFITLTACKTVLYGGLPEAESNKIIAILSEYNIAASKVIGDKGSVSIEVDESDFARAVDILSSFNLPSQSYSAMSDLFKSDSIVKSPIEEWTRYSYALSQELAKSISSIPSVVSASVNLSYPIKNSPFEETNEPSASVLVLMHGNAIGAETIPQIKQIVAFGVDNLAVDRIGVVLIPVEPPQKINVQNNFSDDTSSSQFAGGNISIIISILLFGVLSIVGGMYLYQNYKSKKA